MTSFDLGQVKAITFKDFLLIALSKQFLHANDGKQIVFDTKLNESKLTLSANLSKLDSVKKVDTNAM